MDQNVAANVPDRTEVVAHYIIRRSRPEKLGSIKLNKVMWFADIAAYRRLGHTITGQASYQKRQHGPVPNDMKSALTHLRYDGKIVTREVQVGAHLRHEHVWIIQPDMSKFSADEVDILNEAIEWVCDGHTAKSISDLTHDALWEAAEIGEQIPIGAASVEPDEIDADDIAWALEQLQAA